jgi:hypothetical protein
VEGEWGEFAERKERGVGGGEGSLRNGRRGEFAEQEEKGACGTEGQGSLRNRWRRAFAEL